MTTHSPICTIRDGTFIIRYDHINISMSLFEAMLILCTPKLAHGGPVEGEYDPTSTTSDDFGMFSIIEDRQIWYQGCLGAPWQYFDAYGFHDREFLYVMAYDVGSRRSFDAVKRDCHRVTCKRRITIDRPCAMESQLCESRPPFYGFVLIIANKSGWEECEWAVSLDEGEKFANSIGAMFFPVSVLSREGGGKGLLLLMTYHILLRRIENLENGRERVDS